MTDKQRPDSPFSVRDIAALGRELTLALPGRGRTVCLPVIGEDRQEGAVRLERAATRRTQSE